MSKKIILIITLVIIAVLMTWLYKSGLLPGVLRPGSGFRQIDKEKGCLDSGGEVAQLVCCREAGEFPSSCLVGACDCSFENSQEVKICECGFNRCFDGQKCISKGSYIKVISPNGNEELLVGGVYDITWGAVGVEKVDIVLKEAGDVKTNIALGADAGAGKYSWEIAFDELPLSVNEAGELKIMVSDSNNQAVRDESDNFFKVIR